MLYLYLWDFFLMAVVFSIERLFVINKASGKGMLKHLLKKYKTKSVQVILTKLLLSVTNNKVLLLML